MEGISSEVVLRCLLARIKTHSKEQHVLFGILSKKVKYGKLTDAEAEGYCLKQGWLERNLYSVPLENGGKHYKHVVEVTELGLQQIPILWEESKLNPKNVWIRRMNTSIPLTLSLLALGMSDTVLSAICDLVKNIVDFCSNYIYLNW